MRGKDSTICHAGAVELPKKAQWTQSIAARAFLTYYLQIFPMPKPSDQNEPYDVIVVGAGAAGLLAAARSAERGRRTLLLEKNRKAGVKILMSGGTRCNITHDCDAAGIIAAFGSAGPLPHSPLAALGPRALGELLRPE